MGEELQGEEKRNTEAGGERQSLEFRGKDKRNSVMRSSRRRKEKADRKWESHVG